MPDIDPIPDPIDKTTAIPKEIYKPGVVETVSKPIALFSQAKVEYDITKLTDPAISLTLEIEVSEDGNAWKHMAGCTCPGGVFTQKDGSPATTLSLVVSNPSKVNQLVRVRTTLTGGDLETSGMLSWL